MPRNIKCFLVEKTENRIVQRSGDKDISVALYRRTDTGEELPLGDFPAGAIWRIPWYEDVPELTGIDGKSYACKTPGGTWIIDSRASNCSKPLDTVHKCWCRHGEPPEFTVDKHGNTCQAGAGSIVCGNYHGFLKNGYLEEC